VSGAEWPAEKGDGEPGRSGVPAAPAGAGEAVPPGQRDERAPRGWTAAAVCLDQLGRPTPARPRRRLGGRRHAPALRPGRSHRARPVRGRTVAVRRRCHGGAHLLRDRRCRPTARGHPPPPPTLPGRTRRPGCSGRQLRVPRLRRAGVMDRSAPHRAVRAREAHRAPRTGAAVPRPPPRRPRGRLPAVANPRGTRPRPRPDGHPLPAVVRGEKLPRPPVPEQRPKTVFRARSPGSRAVDHPATALRPDRFRPRRTLGSRPRRCGGCWR
jgi:hypothetical protein